MSSEHAGAEDRGRRGLMLVLSSPSGAGKTSLARRLASEHEDVQASISATTRAPRPGETEGLDYQFLSAEAFSAMVARGEFLEWAEVFGHRYGTPRAQVEQALHAGRDVLFDIDWQGARQLEQTAYGDLVRVFVLPPSVDELERRLTARAQDSADTIRVRMSKAAQEMSHWAEYDYVLVNDDFERTYRDLEAILMAERRRRRRQLWINGLVSSLSKAAQAR